MGSSCGSCAARRAKNSEVWVWTSPDGTQTSRYEGKYAEVQAKAKVSRVAKRNDGQGGTAEPVVASPS